MVRVPSVYKKETALSKGSAQRPRTHSLRPQFQPDNKIGYSSCRILRTDANPLVGEVHDRMPVTLGHEDWPKWFGEEAVPFDASRMTYLARRSKCRQGEERRS